MYVLEPLGACVVANQGRPKSQNAFAASPSMSESTSVITLPRLSSTSSCRAEIAKREKLEKALVGARRALEASENKMAALEKANRLLGEQVKQQAEKNSKQQDEIARLLAAIQQTRLDVALYPIGHESTW